MGRGSKASDLLYGGGIVRPEEQRIDYGRWRLNRATRRALEQLIGGAEDAELCSELNELARRRQLDRPGAARLFAELAERLVVHRGIQYGAAPSAAQRRALRERAVAGLRALLQAAEELSVLQLAGLEIESAVAGDPVLRGGFPGAWGEHCWRRFARTLLEDRRDLILERRFLPALHRLAREAPQSAVLDLVIESFADTATAGRSRAFDYWCLDPDPQAPVLTEPAEHFGWPSADSYIEHFSEALGLARDPLKIEAVRARAREIAREEIEDHLAAAEQPSPGLIAGAGRDAVAWACREFADRELGRLSLREYFGRFPELAGEADYRQPGKLSEKSVPQGLSEALWQAFHRPVSNGERIAAAHARVEQARRDWLAGTSEPSEAL
jgi:hypothetical protein